ncbi:unnamed protein product [Caretta caretta]
MGWKNSLLVGGGRERENDPDHTINSGRLSVAGGHLSLIGCGWEYKRRREGGRAPFSFPEPWWEVTACL